MQQKANNIHQKFIIFICKAIKALIMHANALQLINTSRNDEIKKRIIKNNRIWWNNDEKKFIIIIVKTYFQ